MKTTQTLIENLKVWNFKKVKQLTIKILVKQKDKFENRDFKAKSHWKLKFEGEKTTSQEISSQNKQLTIGKGYTLKIYWKKPSWWFSAFRTVATGGGKRCWLFSILDFSHHPQRTDPTLPSQQNFRIHNNFMLLLVSPKINTF